MSLPTYMAIQSASLKVLNATQAICEAHENKDIVVSKAHIAMESIEKRVPNPEELDELGRSTWQVYLDKKAELMALLYPENP